MNWDRVEGSWKQIRGKAQKKWGDLTDDDMDKISGKRDMLVGKIQERYGSTREDAERAADDFAASLEESENPSRA